MRQRTLVRLVRGPYNHQHRHPPATHNSIELASDAEAETRRHRCNGRSVAIFERRGVETSQ